MFRKMLIYNPTERISAREASQHIYLAPRTLLNQGSSAVPVENQSNIVSSELNYLSLNSEQNNVQGSNMDIEVSDGVSGKRRGRETTTSERLRYTISYIYVYIYLNY
jgi:serine/threonine protein kinase